MVEHCVDIAGVASSILATPTISFPENSDLEDPDRCSIGPVLARFVPQNATCLGIYWARRGQGANAKEPLTTNKSVCGVDENSSRTETLRGAGSFGTTGGRLHASAPARRSWTSGQREALGQGFTSVEQRVIPLSRTKNPAHDCPDRDVGVPAVEDPTQPGNPV